MASMIVAGGLNEICGRIISFILWRIDCSIVRSGSSPIERLTVEDEASSISRAFGA